MLAKSRSPCADTSLSDRKFFLNRFLICTPDVSTVSVAEMGVRPHQPIMFISHEIYSISHVTAF